MEIPDTIYVLYLKAGNEYLFMTVMSRKALAQEFADNRMATRNEKIEVVTFTRKEDDPNNPTT